MKIVSFRDGARASYGVTDGDGIVDMGPLAGERLGDVRAVLDAGALDDVRAAADGRSSDLALSDVTVLPPVRGPNAVLVVGRNYGTAYADMGTGFPGYPSIFMRRYASQAGHNQPLVRPKASPNFDCEVELAVIIGRGGRHIPEDESLGHIAGYSIFNDGSVTDWMDHTSRNVTPGKNFAASGSFGPWMVTADEISDPQNLAIEHRLNGEVIQSGNTADMIFSIARVIAYLSTFTPLEPGDVISTGSPGGIRGRRGEGQFLVPGDAVEMEIEGIGVLAHKVVDEA